eukprot:TRINITY_DN19506_c0_g1_i1.p1 TRINITY_DN19506_c0_g1~~TRINITY_DN19506_c0_g1_i1.p1  ORF type:complete len:243 (+),score=40.54 TRINITY_DN19506_c0_g1_i1:151-879(+)
MATTSDCGSDASLGRVASPNANETTVPSTVIKQGRAVDGSGGGIDEDGRDVAFFKGQHVVRKKIAEERIQRVLMENTTLSTQLAEANNKLRDFQSSRDELDVIWKASANLTERQKLVTQSLAKNAQHIARQELQRLGEAAQTICELEDVIRRLQMVNRQLRFATDLQTQTKLESESRLAARARRIRKLELAIYSVVSHAQCDPRLEGVVTSLVGKSGTLVQSVLSREARRQALELTVEEEGA